MTDTDQRETTSRDTKAEIHRAALELFSAQGYDKTSLREIAERVGITKASLYYHYSSKHDLLQAIVGTFFDDMREVLLAVRDTEWSPEHERELIGRYLEVVIRHRDSGPAMLRDLAAVLAVAAENMDELVRLIQGFHAWLAGPAPSTLDRQRAVAATETIGSVLSSGLTPSDVPDEQMLEVVLDCTLAVLDRRDNVPFKHLETGGRTLAAWPHVMPGSRRSRSMPATSRTRPPGPWCRRSTRPARTSRTVWAACATDTSTPGRRTRPGPRWRSAWPPSRPAPAASPSPA